jgi:hypothetical protein
MLTERGKLFEEKEPSLSDDEVSAAYENGKIAASLKGKPLATSPENIGLSPSSLRSTTALLRPCCWTTFRRGRSRR